MARKKGRVIGCEHNPNPEEAAPGAADHVDSLQAPSRSDSTSSTTGSTCPHCKSTLQDMSTTDFRDHVASRTRPNTADTRSSLTPPPASPSQLLAGPASADEPEKVPEEVEEEIVDNSEVRQPQQDVLNEPAVDEQEIQDDNAANDPEPYVNPEADYDYYDAIEPREESDPSQNQGEPFGRFPFPKVTNVEAFEAYLKNSEDMDYEELYRRTAKVSNSLAAYQAEWDAIDKEIYEHEARLKSEEKRVDEEAKEAIKEDKLKEERERDQVEKDYAWELSLTAKQWQGFLARHEKTIPKETMRHLQNLKNPQFMAAARKKHRTAENKNSNLINAPWPEVKKTKEDIELERRQRGRYMDPVKFDDMKQADVYGVEYSTHIKHYGQQPLTVMARQVDSKLGPTSQPTGDDPNDASRTRTQRKMTRKVYEAEVSKSPESEEEGNNLPSKRSRKPKIFVDGVETSERSRGDTRSATPAVRTFASGKRVGRPPAKSKLQAVQLAEPSQSPALASGSEAQKVEGGEGLVGDKGIETRDLAPSQEAQLHDAAESLVSQTHTDIAAAAVPVAKPKHAGGRPRKIRTENPESGTQSALPAPVSQPKRKHPGGRPRKNPLPMKAESAAVAESEAPVLNPNPAPKKRVRRPIKKETVPEDGLVQFEENGVLQSTEQDDDSNNPSGATTRPTTSDSQATLSTTTSRRSARPSTRDKTNAVETRKTRASTVVREPASLSTPGRNKRKRDSPDTDPSPIVVESLPIADQPTKKRKVRGQQAPNDTVELQSAASVPEVSNGRSKRKHANITNDAISVVDNAVPVDQAAPPKKRKRGAKAEKIKEEPDVEEEDSDAGIDEESLDPIAREALRKKRIKKEKSRKLSRNMKARWASGGMKEAQETRRANNAIKRAHKEQTLANEAAGLPPPPPPILHTAPVPNQAPEVSAPEPQIEAEVPVETNNTNTALIVDAPTVDAPAVSAAAEPPQKKARTKAKAAAAPPPPPPTRPASTRIRKPSRLAMGLDGADDENDDEAIDDDEDIDEENGDGLQQHFTSEYERFQALTSPTQPQFLGKRVRKSFVDLRELMTETEEEEEVEDEDEDEF